jgi:hypothetical protein
VTGNFFTIDVCCLANNISFLQIIFKKKRKEKKKKEKERKKKKKKRKEKKEKRKKKNKRGHKRKWIKAPCNNNDLIHTV